MVRFYGAGSAWAPSWVTAPLHGGWSQRPPSVVQHAPTPGSRAPARRHPGTGREHEVPEDEHDDGEAGTDGERHADPLDEGLVGRGDELGPLPDPYPGAVDPAR